MTRYTLACTVAALCGVFASADELKTLTDKKYTGTLEKITDSQIVMKVDGKSISTPLPSVLELTLRPAKTEVADKHIEVTLVDDSVVRCTKVDFNAKDVRLELTSGFSVTAPLAAIHTVLRDAQDPTLRKKWVEFLKDKTRQDRIFILRMGALNPIAGVLGAVDEKKQTIHFKPESFPAMEPELEKVQGLQFVRIDSASEPGLCRLIDIDGNVLVASKLNSDGAKVNVTTPFGQKVSLELKQVARFDFNFGRLTYLSDLPAKMPDAILLGGFNPVRKDANLDGYPIMLQGKQYAKGLSMYAVAQLEYNLDSKYKTLKGLLGVDARIAEEGQGKVTVSIYCDNEKRFVAEVSTKVPTPISLNVKDVGKLRIVVTGSNFTNYAGHATLANLHVSQ